MIAKYDTHNNPYLRNNFIKGWKMVYVPYLTGH